MRRVTFVLAILLSLLVGIFLQWKFSILDKVIFIKTSQIEKDIAKFEKPISALTIVDLETCKLDIQINPDDIWIGAYENLGCDTKRPLSIERQSYPKLFKQGVAGMSFITIERVENSNSLVLVSNSQPDHGGYSSVYQLTVNIKTGEIVENEVRDFFQEKKQ